MPDTRIKIPVLDDIPPFLDPSEAQGRQLASPPTPNVFYAILSKDLQYNTIRIGYQNITPGMVGYVNFTNVSHEFLLFWLPASQITAAQIAAGDVWYSTLATIAPFASLVVSRGGGIQEYQDFDPTHLLGRGWYFGVAVSLRGIQSDVVSCAVPYNGDVWEATIPPDISSPSGSAVAMGHEGGGADYLFSYTFTTPAASNSFAGAQVFIANYGTIGATPVSVAFLNGPPGSRVITGSVKLCSATAGSGTTFDVYACSVSNLGTRKQNPTSGVHFTVTI